MRLADPVAVMSRLQAARALRRIGVPAGEYSANSLPVTVCAGVVAAALAIGVGVVLTAPVSGCR
jgi:hypothetical protein